MRTLIERDVNKLLFHSPAPGCVLYLLGLPGGGGKIYDRSPYGNHGAITGATWKVTKGGLWYLYFVTDDYVNGIGSVSSFSFIQNTGIFTLKCWLKLDDNTAAKAQCLIANTPASDEKGFFFAYKHGGAQNNQLRLFIVKGQSGIPVIDSYSPIDVITDNDWHQVGATGDNTNVTFYVDAAPYSGTNAMGDKSSGDSTRVLNIGRYPYSTPGDYLDGCLALPEIHSNLWTALDFQNSFNREKHLFGVC